MIKKKFDRRAFHGKMAEMRRARQGPQKHNAHVPAPVAAVTATTATTSKTICVAAHAFDSSDGLSKVAGGLVRGFKALGWRVSTVNPTQQGWWSRVPADTELTLVALFPDVVKQPPPSVPRRLIWYTMFESSRVPVNWAGKLDRAETVFVPLPFLVDAMRRGGVTAQVRDVGFGWDGSAGELRPRSARKRLGCLAVAGRKKNLIQLVEAFGAARLLRPDLELHLHSRTVSEPDYTRALVDLSRQVPGFSFTQGDLGRDRVEQWWSQLDGYVLVSHSEGLSLTPREAVSRGLPCVLSQPNGVMDRLRQA